MHSIFIHAVAFTALLALLAYSAKAQLFERPNGLTRQFNANEEPPSPAYAPWPEHNPYGRFNTPTEPRYIRDPYMDPGGSRLDGGQYELPRTYVGEPNVQSRRLMVHHHS